MKNSGKLAIITARGGSRRIPRKNIKDFCGKPIIAYSIEAALKSGAFDTVMVSTDDEEIAGIARQYGAEVPFFRDAKTSDDHSTTSDVLKEVLAAYEKRGERYDTACCLYPTAPFVTAEKLRTAMERLADAGADVLIPVTAFSYPIQRAMIIEDGKLVFRHPEYLNSRSQDLEPHYHDAGQFYVFHTEAFLRTGQLIAGNILPLVVSEMEVQDIDNITDWKIAEMKYRLMTGGNQEEK